MRIMAARVAFMAAHMAAPGQRKAGPAAENVRRLSLGGRLQRFPDILDHSVIQYDQEAPSILVLAHVLVGEPDPLRRDMR
jgi:hypothetical protein